MYNQKLCIARRMREKGGEEGREGGREEGRERSRKEVGIKKRRKSANIYL